VSTSIEWTDHTLQPGIYGCSIASPACEHCYAATMAHRQAAMGNYPLVTAKRGTKGVHWTGEVRVDFDAIAPAFAKLPKRKPARVFVTSMADLFHADVPWDFIGEVFRHMAQRPHLTFQVLTKRPDHMAEWYATTQRGAKWPAHIWAGTTVEDQRRADERIPHLLKVPAKVRFLSMEPLLGAVTLDMIAVELDGLPGCVNALTGEWWPAVGDADEEERNRQPFGEGRIDWVITGGESGRNARPSHPDWFRSLRDQCASAGVPFFFKQWGEWAPSDDIDANSKADHRYAEQYAEDGGVPRHRWPDAPVRETARRLGKGELGHDVSGDTTVFRVGKAAAGRLLDGVEHSAFPEAP
jgi:protein gp37